MSNFTTHRDSFSSLLPDLIRMASAAFRHFDPEAREEAVQNSLALAWYFFQSLIEKGRGDEQGIIKSCLWFSIRQTRAGRTVPNGGAAKPKDAYNYAKKGRVRFEEIDLRRFVADDTPIPEAVAFRLDVPAFLDTLNDRQRLIAEDLMAGETTSAVADKHGITPGAVSQFRTRFRQLFDAFMAA